MKELLAIANETILSLKDENAKLREENKRLQALNDLTHSNRDDDREELTQAYEKEIAKLRELSNRGWAYVREFEKERIKLHKAIETAKELLTESFNHDTHPGCMHMERIEKFLQEQK